MWQNMFEKFSFFNISKAWVMKSYNLKAIYHENRQKKGESFHAVTYILQNHLCK